MNTPIIDLPESPEKRIRTFTDTIDSLTGRKQKDSDDSQMISFVADDGKTYAVRKSSYPGYDRAIEENQKRTQELIVAKKNSELSAAKLRSEFDTLWKESQGPSKIGPPFPTPNFDAKADIAEEISKLDFDLIELYLAINMGTPVKKKGGEGWITKERAARELARAIRLPNPNQLLKKGSVANKVLGKLAAKAGSTPDSPGRILDDAGVTGWQRGHWINHPGVSHDSNFDSYMRSLGTVLSPSSTVSLLAGDPRSDEERASSKLNVYGATLDEDAYRAITDIAVNAGVSILTAGTSSLLVGGAKGLSKTSLRSMLLAGGKQASGGAALRTLANSSATSVQKKAAATVLLTNGLKAGSSNGLQLTPGVMTNARDIQVATGKSYGESLRRSIGDTAKSQLDQFNPMVWGDSTKSTTEKLTTTMNILGAAGGNPRSPKHLRQEFTGTVKSIVPTKKIKSALEHGALTWNLGREVYRAGGGVKAALEEVAENLSGFRKTKSHVAEEKLGNGLHPARAQYHLDLDRTARLGFLSGVAVRNLKVMHDGRAHRWAKNNGRLFSEYFAEHAPLLSDRMERHAERGNVRGQVLSTRLPGGVHETTKLHIADMDALKASRAHAANVAAALGQVPGMKRIYREGKDVNLMLEEFAEFMADNLVWLHDQTPEDVRKLLQQTFYGANKLATRLAVRHKLPLENVAGALAVLTPRTEWNHSVTNVERILDAMKNGRLHVMDEAMASWASRKFSTDDFDRIRGRTYNELIDSKDKAIWIQAYDRIHHRRGYRTSGLGGRFGAFQIAKHGGEKGRFWNQIADLKKAIESLEAESPVEVSKKLGNYAKVRNIYNNIVDPYADHPFVATDVHLISGSLARPVSSIDGIARDAYGSKLWDSAPTGLSGTNPVFLEAAKIAARRLGITRPHEIQSIAWHMSGSLFDRSLKRSSAKEKIHALWTKVDNGELSREGALAETFILAGGFTSSGSQAVGTTRNSSSHR